MIKQRLEYTDDEYKLYHIVDAVAKMSYCQDKRVGAVVLDYMSTILGTGYNRILNCNSQCDKSCTVEHAEVMACKNIPFSLGGPYTMFTNLFPCPQCQEEAARHGVGRIVVFGDRGKKLYVDCVEIVLLPDIAAWLLAYNGRDGRDGPRNCRQIFQGEMSELITAISNHDAREDRPEAKAVLMDAMIEEEVDVSLQTLIFRKSIWPKKEVGQGAHKWNKLIDKFKGHFLIGQ